MASTTFRRLVSSRMRRVVDPSRSTASGGAGIGLSIVAQLVDAWGGEVGAASAGGRTSVWFTVPG